MITSCPVRRSLERFLTQQLSDEDQESVLSHLDGCPSCLSVLEELTTMPGTGGSESQPSTAAGEPSADYWRRLISTPAYEIVARPGCHANLSTPHDLAEDTGLCSRRPQSAGDDWSIDAASGQADAPADPAELQLLGEAGFEMASRLGRGGMGVVYQARKVGLGRWVAVKLISAEAAADPAYRARFRVEAEAVARLQHPNIVQIHEVGERGGRSFLTLEYVDGGTLAQCIAGKPRDPALAVSLIEALAHAIHYAHQRGIVHRDLKPANILVTSDGVAKITDFGLAKRLDAQTQHTMGGDLIGTPSYMAPEQAQGKNEEVGPAADVYALGAVLYELLTGRPPFLASTPLDTLQQVVNAEPVPPAQLNPQIPRDLATICLKCLRKEPAKRYASAADLAEDLRRFGAHEPILARPTTRAEKAWRWCRRHPRESVLGSLVLVAILFGAVAAARFVRERRTRAAEATQAIEESLQDVLLLQGQAQAAAVGDMARWDAARAAMRRTEGLLGYRTVDAPLYARVQGLRAELDREEEVARARAEELHRDRAMVQELSNIRLLKAAIRNSYFDARSAAGPYARAFQAYGTDIVSLPQDVAVEQLRRSAIRAQLVAALDDWYFCEESQALRTKLDHIVAQSDPNNWRHRIRGQGTIDADALKAIADSPDALSLPPASLCVLGNALHACGLRAEAVAFLAKAQQLHADDFWINMNLATLLSRRKPYPADLVLRYCTAALALHPSSPGAHLILGNALNKKGDLDEALTAYNKAIALQPDFAMAYGGRGDVLARKGLLVEAVAAQREALRLEPDSAAAHCELGAALEAQGKLDEAETLFRKAMALDPNFALPHYNLGVVLYRKKRHAEAITACKEAIRLDPTEPRAYVNLGLLLREQGELEEALAVYRQAIVHGWYDAKAHSHLGTCLLDKGLLDEARVSLEKAIRLDPNLAEAHVNLGNLMIRKKSWNEARSAFQEALRLQPRLFEAQKGLGIVNLNDGRLDAAIACYQAARELKPGDASVHLDLGRVLARQGSLDAAIASFREAIRLKADAGEANYSLGNALARKGAAAEAVQAFQQAIRHRPDFAEAHCNLGHALKSQGKFREALEAMKRGHELGSRNPNWRYPSQQWVQECLQLMQLDEKATAFQRDQVQLTTAVERIELADFCFRYKRLPGCVVRLYTEAFAAQPGLADAKKDAHRYQAACAAALAASGQGEDATALSVEERARLREQARAWLLADLRSWSKDWDGLTQPDQVAARQTLQRWLSNPALAGLRESEHLDKLPSQEKEVCQRVWQEVRSLVNRMDVK